MYVVKRLVTFATALLMCSYGVSSQIVYRATFNSAVFLGFGWSLRYFAIVRPKCDNPAGLFLESLGATNSI